MFDLLHKLLGTSFSSGQARNIGALIGAAIAVLAFLLFANIAVWLLGWLWTVTSSGPFGFGGFVVTLALAGGVGYYVWSALRAEPELTPAVSNEAQLLAERWTREIEARAEDIAPAERERWSSPLTETPGALKAKTIAALNRATSTRKTTDLDEAERLAAALALIPEMAETADHYQYEIAYFRKRL